MGKKVKEYKSGDFIFAKVKGYPAWPARVQRPNGKKYFVYFYGTGETANLAPNMIFDYAENKDKFLTKTVKRRDFNDGVKQIEHDFANNVPLEDVIGAPQDGAAEAANDTANDTGNDTMEDSAIDTTAADDTIADTSTATQNDTAVEDSDDAGGLVIDEGKQGKKGKAKAAEPAKTPKTPKAPRGRPKKEEEEKEEELVSRSGRKIRPKRYLDEQTEENATLPSPAPKRKRPASPPADRDKPADSKEKSVEKNMKHFNNVPRSELEELKEPFKPADPEKENILIAYLPSGQYVGIKLFQSRPAACSDEARLSWDQQAAKNALTLHRQLERGQITPQSVLAQLVMDLNLTDEEKATLDKEREAEEKRSRVQFLKTEMKLIELDAKIKTCLCLERADTALCLKLLQQLLELDVKPLMLLKHPTCLETVKRMRAYVGNTPSWALSEAQALEFAKQAHNIRRQAHQAYNSMKEMFNPPAGVSFWEYFSGQVLQFKKATAALGADQLLELVHEPIELSQPSAVTMSAAAAAADEDVNEDDTPKKKNAKTTKKSTTSTPAKTPAKRQNSKKQDDNKEADATSKKPSEETDKETDDAQTDKANDATDGHEANDVEMADNTDQTKENDNEDDNAKSPEEATAAEEEQSNEKEKEVEKDTEEENTAADSNEVAESDEIEKDTDKAKDDNEKQPKENGEKDAESESSDKVVENDKESSEDGKDSKEEKTSNKKDKDSKETSREVRENSKKGKEVEKSKKNDKGKESDKKEKESSEKVKDGSEKVKESSEKVKEGSEKVKESSDSGKKDKEDEKEDEPRAKRSRGENKKTEPPPRSPAKRKAKA